MRFALSAMAGTSGLLLLGLAFYGQPAVYLQQAREEWNGLFSNPGAEQPADPDRDAVAERMAALQQQVARLKDELATKQVLVPQPEAEPPTRLNAPDVRPQQAVLQPQAMPAPQPGSGATQPSAGKIAPVAGPVSQPPMAAMAPSVADPPSVGPVVRSEPPKPDRPASSTTGLPNEPLPLAIVVPQRQDLTTAEHAGPVEAAKPDAAKPEPVRSEPAKTELSKPDLSKPELAKAEFPRPVAQKPGTVKPPPLLSSPRQDVDDTQSVLARLRQIAPATAPQPETPGAAEPRQVEARPAPPPSPSLPKLTLARAALASGRIDDARRLLQEAQLQLVFRPVNVSGEELPLAGKGAADVAHALEALSANNIPLSRRYIDIAADDLSGNGTNLAGQASELRATGYAPAYPPR